MPRAGNWVNTNVWQGGKPNQLVAEAKILQDGNLGVKHRLGNPLIGDELQSAAASLPLPDLGYDLRAICPNHRTLAVAPPSLFGMTNDDPGARPCRLADGLCTKMWVCCHAADDGPSLILIGIRRATLR